MTKACIQRKVFVLRTNATNHSCHRWIDESPPWRWWSVRHLSRSREFHSANACKHNFVKAVLHALILNSQSKIFERRDLKNQFIVLNFFSFSPLFKIEKTVSWMIENTKKNFEYNMHCKSSDNISSGVTTGLSQGGNLAERSLMFTVGGPLANTQKKKQTWEMMLNPGVDG